VRGELPVARVYARTPGGVVSELAAAMIEGDFKILVQCEWTGLTGRQLYVHNARRYLGSGKAAQDTVRTNGRFPGLVRDVLPEAVRSLTAPLYERFDFTEIPDFVYVEELNDMTKGKCCGGGRKAGCPPTAQRRRSTPR